MLTFNKTLTNDSGEFYLVESKQWFTFRLTTDHWALSHKFLHEIDVGTSSYPEVRFANVLKTVANVVIDEDENGYPVVESWKITKKTKHI